MVCDFFLGLFQLGNIFCVEEFILTYREFVFGNCYIKSAVAVVKGSFLKKPLQQL